MKVSGAKVIRRYIRSENERRGNEVSVKGWYNQYEEKIITLRSNRKKKGGANCASYPL